MQMNCNVCHRYDRETKGAEFINLGKQLVQEKGCRACHVVNGRGGTIGPDLTYVGDKAPEQYDYGRLSGQKTSFAWHVAHLKDPRALVPGHGHAQLPPLDEGGAGARHARDVVAQGAGAGRVRGRRAAHRSADGGGEGGRAADEGPGPGAWFVKTGCFVCHSISALGVKSPAQIGPDLSTAVEDVQTRFGRTVDDFLREPTGTMSVVLSRQIILTPEQKQTAVEKLREAFAEHERQKKDAEKASPGQLIRGYHDTQSEPHK